MAGEAEMRRAVAANCDHILGRPVGRFAHHPAVDVEAERLERGLEQSKTSPRAGVTLGQGISADARAIGSIGSAIGDA